MTIGRRDLMLGGIGAGLAAAPGPRAAAASEEPEMPAPFSTYGIVPGGGIDQTASLQEAADKAAQSGTPFFLPPGDYTTAKLALKSGTEIQGVPGKSVLRYNGGGALISIEDAAGIRLTGLTLDGEAKPIDGAALLIAEGVKGLSLSECLIAGSAADGVVLRKVSGRITDCEIGDIRGGGLFSEDATGLEIGHNHVRDCGDNGILVWRSAVGEDGTIITANRIERITAKSGGSGQNGNGINVFRAGSVMVSNNRITDCTFSAIRSNSGSNCQMIGNSCARLGEVALYAEFGFEGAVIANNIVDDAADGHLCHQFQRGRPARRRTGQPHPQHLLPQGCRLARRRHRCRGRQRGERQRHRDCSGLRHHDRLGRYLRDVSVTGNLIRNAHIGIGVSTDALAGTALTTDNLITGAKDGAIRAMNGATPTGPDLATASAEAYRNLVVSTNVAR